MIGSQPTSACPARWRCEAIGKVAPVKQARFPDGEAVAWNLSLEDIEPHTGRVLNRRFFKVSELGSSKCAFDCSNVLYSKLRPYLNKVVVPDSPGVGTSELIPLRPDPEKLDRVFLAFYLRSPAFLEFATQHMQGANLPRVAMDDFWKCPVPLPALAEQRRIVARITECFDRIDEIETLKSASTNEAAATLPSVLEASFEEIGFSHRAVSIGDIAIDTRYGTSIKCSHAPAGVAVLRIPNVAKGSVDLTDLKFCDLDSSALRRLSLSTGDILFVRTNGSPDLVGRSAVFESPGDGQSYSFASYLIRIRLDQSRVLPQFAAYFLNSSRGREEIRSRRRTSAGQFNINSENLKTISFPLPPISEQRSLLEVFENAERSTKQLADTLRSAEGELKLLRASVLHRAFKGEL